MVVTLRGDQIWKVDVYSVKAGGGGRVIERERFQRFATSPLI